MHDSCERMHDVARGTRTFCYLRTCMDFPPDAHTEFDRCVPINLTGTLRLTRSKLSSGAKELSNLSDTSEEVSNLSDTSEVSASGTSNVCHWSYTNDRNGSYTNVRNVSDIGLTPIHPPMRSLSHYLHTNTHWCVSLPSHQCPCDQCLITFTPNPKPSHQRPSDDNLFALTQANPLPPPRLPSSGARHVRIRLPSQPYGFFSSRPYGV